MFLSSHIWTYHNWFSNQKVFSFFHAMTSLKLSSSFSPSLQNCPSVFQFYIAIGSLIHKCINLTFPAIEITFHSLKKHCAFHSQYLCSDIYIPLIILHCSL